MRPGSGPGSSHASSRTSSSSDETRRWSAATTRSVHWSPRGATPSSPSIRPRSTGTAGRRTRSSRSSRRRSARNPTTPTSGGSSAFPDRRSYTRSGPMPGLHRLLAMVLLLALGGCQEAPKTSPSVDDATIKRRVAEYYQKTVTQPGLAFEVTKLEESELPGWRKGTLKVSQGQQSQDVAFQVTRDGHFLFRSDLVDLTTDPVQEVRKQ